jgi:hypothetical protein
MLSPSDLTGYPRRLRGDYGSLGLQGQVDSVSAPIAVREASTEPQQPVDTAATTASVVNAARAKYYAPTSGFAPSESASADAAVIQVWEGTVLRVDRENQSMLAKLHAKIGAIPDHSGEIDLEWVADQDADLVCPGAVFYLTLYKKRKKGGTIENSQELRFRRRPSWSRQQIASIDAAAERLLSKFRASADAND